MAEKVALSLPIKNTFVHFGELLGKDSTPMAEMDGSPVKIRSRRARSEGRKGLFVSTGSSGSTMAPTLSDFGVESPLTEPTDDEEEGSNDSPYDSRKSGSSTESSPKWSSETEGERQPLPVPSLRHDDMMPFRMPALSPQQPAHVPQPVLAAADRQLVVPAPRAVVAPRASPAGQLASAVWTLEGEEMSSTRNKVCSGQFRVPVAGVGQCLFEIFIYAEDRLSKAVPGKTQGFQRSGGRGRLEIRSQNRLPPGKGRLVVNMVVGAGHSQGLWKGPVTHDFSEKVCLGWRHVDFRSAVDPATHTLTVCADFAPVQ